MIEIRTKNRIEIVDITSQVREKIRKSGVNEGIALVYSKHTTTAITINENESGLKEDIIKCIKNLIPSSAGYSHDRIDNNADSHLRAILIGNSVAVPVTDGNPELGTWQSILFIELDGPRSRRVGVKVVGA
ncbi:MAG TPA: YjbQ family protein [Archaeoglobaceae archaeon]|nr:YjbQ family protein [Archaeoglobaceae archaeon]